MEKVRLLWKVFSTFFRIGAFTFGGGYAMIPLIQREACEKNHWVSEDDILEIVAIAESTPGPIAINGATFVGYKVCGFWGSVCATLGVVVPSFAIIFLLTNLLTAFQENPYVGYAFFGIRAGVLALIVKAMIGMYKKCPNNLLSYGVMAGVFVSVVFLELPVIAVLIASALIALAVTNATGRKKV